MKYIFYSFLFSCCFISFSLSSMYDFDPELSYNGISGSLRCVKQTEFLIALYKQHEIFASGITDICDIENFSAKALKKNYIIEVVDNSVICAYHKKIEEIKKRTKKPKKTKNLKKIFQKTERTTIYNYALASVLTGNFIMTFGESITNRIINTVFFARDNDVCFYKLQNGSICYFDDEIKTIELLLPAHGRHDFLKQGDNCAITLSLTSDSTAYVMRAWGLDGICYSEVLFNNIDEDGDFLNLVNVVPCANNGIFAVVECDLGKIYIVDFLNQRISQPFADIAKMGSMDKFYAMNNGFVFFSKQDEFLYNSWVLLLNGELEEVTIYLLEDLVENVEELWEKRFANKLITSFLLPNNLLLLKDRQGEIFLINVVDGEILYSFNARLSEKTFFYCDEEILYDVGNCYCHLYKINGLKKIMEEVASKNYSIIDFIKICRGSELLYFTQQSFSYSSE